MLESYFILSSLEDFPIVNQQLWRHDHFTQLERLDNYEHSWFLTEKSNSTMVKSTI